jgi:hypothetical protein
MLDLVGDDPADVVVIQNSLKYDTRVTAREGYIWKWDNEPIVATPIARGYDHSTDTWILLKAPWLIQPIRSWTGGWARHLMS